MQLNPVALEETVIGRTLRKFAAGDPSIFELIADEIDFRIDHFRDDAETSWQQAGSRDALVQVLGRLGTEVFPKGTEALTIDCVALGGGWHLTRFHQRFHYGVRQRDVTSLTYIVSHETNGKLDFFRETVTDILDVPEPQTA